MREHSLFVKKSKCVFGTSHVEYLGHVISAQGEATDSAKVQAMQTWPVPKNIKQLREFLGLTSLKYLLNQRITTPAQMKWLPKLIGFDYEVIYKQGKDNVVADALSRKEREGECLHINITTVSTALYNQVKQTWLTDNHLKAICHQLKEGQIKKHYSLVNDQLLRKRKVRLWEQMTTRQSIRKEVKQMVKECLVCQKYKPDLAAYPGLLQPLPIPKSVWSSISMDFIKGLPKSQGYNVIMVVVDRLTKYTHLMPLAHPFTAVQVAQAFMDNVCKLHGMPESIVSDRDKVFLSLFWKELFGLLKVKLLMSSAYHPQTDKQNEVVKICLETYLRCMTGDLPKEYSKWLSLAELWYNSNYHSAIQTTAFEALYGLPPPLHVPYMGGISRVDAVDRSLEAREKVVQLLRFHLERAQNKMKQQSDKNRSERVLLVGDWVWLKLQPHMQVSLRQEKQNKFSPKYYGPFEVISKMGDVAYKLNLPEYSQMHDVFHVSQLKKCNGTHQQLAVVPLPSMNKRGLIEVQLVKLLERKIVKQRNAVAVYGLIQWSGGDVQDATWELLEDLCKRFPDFELDP
ncbi:ty3-gypsy retrotransposon protein [Tanacetum coccineum]|uniref:Ty3-gypsy retrotransposon protein n=1 Tax=Tanacetum coccineum TaxID=301880 RepID=A0ABQ5DNA5_9ASTR